MRKLVHVVAGAVVASTRRLARAAGMPLLNTILLASACCVAYGLWLHSHSLAMIVVGLAVMAAAFVAGVSIGQHRSRNLRGGS